MTLSLHFYPYSRIMWTTFPSSSPPSPDGRNPGSVPNFAWNHLSSSREPEHQSRTRLATVAKSRSNWPSSSKFIGYVSVVVRFVASKNGNDPPAEKFTHDIASAEHHQRKVCSRPALHQVPRAHVPRCPHIKQRVIFLFPVCGGGRSRSSQPPFRSPFWRDPTHPHMKFPGPAALRSLHSALLIPNNREDPVHISHK